MTETMTQIITKFLKPALAVIVVAFVITVGLYFKNKADHAKKSSVANELFAIQMKLDKATSELYPSDEPKDKDASAKDEKATKKPEPTLAQRTTAFKPIAEEALSFINSHSGEVVSLEAALLLAQTTEKFEDSALAVKGLKTATEAYSGKKTFLYGVTGNLYANLLQEQDSCEEAAKVWESMLGEPDLGFMENTFRLNAGACYQKLGQNSKAAQLFQRVVDLKPNSTQGKLAKKFLLFLDFKKTQGLGSDVKSEEASSSSANSSQEG